VQDGALVIAAAKLGAGRPGRHRSGRIKEAREGSRGGRAGPMTLIRGDIFDPQIKIGEASVVTLICCKASTRS
jgi:hypothetical protein